MVEMHLAGGAGEQAEMANAMETFGSHMQQARAAQTATVSLGGGLVESYPAIG